MSTVTAEKGNVLRNTRFDHHALVLALTNDNKRAKLHVYGKEEPVWHPLSWYEVIEAGNCTCYKCGGSGLYYFGGMVLNGTYTGQTGPCFACEGKGQQSNADRTRCHYYWHRYGKDVMPDDFDVAEVN